MKKLFRKAITVLGSVALVGATIGGAAAAAYPAPFNAGSYAVVYGADSQDATAASTVVGDLPTLVGTGGTVVGGDSYKFEKASTKFHVGNGLLEIRTSLDEDELPSLLADGKFVDDDNDEFDYTQKITPVNLTLTMFEDNDYIDDEPVLGIKIASSSAVLNYTLEFSDEPLLGDLPTSTLPIMGKEYYVLSNTTSAGKNVLTLLDSASDVTIMDGTPQTLVIGDNSYEVSIDFISATEVALKINGEVTNSLGELETTKLSDGSYVGIKDIRYNAVAGAIGSVQLSIGSGKLKITSESEVQINDVAVSGLTGFITNSTPSSLTNIILQWNADNDLFITETSEVTMPGFEAVKISSTGVEYPVEEVIEIKQGSDTYAVLEDFPLKDGPADIAFLYGVAGGGFSGMGEASDKKLITSNTTSLTFDSDTDEYFIVSYSSTSDAESYLVKASNFILDSTTNKTDISYLKDGTWVVKKSGAKSTDSISLGLAEIGVGTIDRTGKNVTIHTNNTGTNFYELYSKEGLRTYLPFEGDNNTAIPGRINFSTDGTGGILGHNETSFFLNFTEEDKDGNIGSGASFAVQVGWDSSTVPEVEVSDLDQENVSASEIQKTDVYRSFMYSALATEFLWEKPSSGQDSIKIIYHGDEVEAGIYVTSPDATVGGESGVATFTDDQASSYAGRNIVVVGGSCINAVAAELLGSAYCGEDFTGATAVKPGQFLIQSFDYNGKIATLVAGYEKDDTAKGTTYLANEVGTVSTEAGMKYIGQSATEPALLVS